MTSFLLTFSWALAADEPCYGHFRANRIDSEHFWVEWEEGAVTDEQAADIAAYAEEARQVFLELGWPLTDQPIVYELLDDEGGGGIAGLARTFPCGDADVPQVQLYVGDYWDEGARNVTAHELGHAAEYGYTGAYLDGVLAWLWWMEGTATWLALQVDGRKEEWAADADGYLANAHFALQHDLTGFADPATSDHMYGTAWLAAYLAEIHGPDAVRATWEAGASLMTGEPLFFPDVLDAAGLDFAALWSRYLVTTAVGALELGAAVHEQPTAELVQRVPAEGRAADEAPGSLGLYAAHFAPLTGERGKALRVTFDGDPSVPWVVALARTDGSALGSEVLDYTPLTVRNGHAEGWLSGHDGRFDGWLVASPVSPDAGAEWALSWTVELDRDPGPMDETVVLSEVEALGGCGCAGAPGGPGGAWVLVLLWATRRGRGRL